MKLITNKFLIIFAFIFTFILIKSADLIVGNLFNKNYYNYYYQKNFQNNGYIKLKEMKPNLDIYIRPFPSTVKTKKLQEKYRLLTDKNSFIIGSKNKKVEKIDFIFMGGSTTENIFVNQDNRFPYKVGLLLNMNSKNAGVSSINSFDNLNILINKIRFLKPKNIILMNNMNDLSSLIYSETTNYNDMILSRKSVEYLDDNNFSNQYTKYDFLKYIKNIFIPNIFEIYSKTRFIINLKNPKHEFSDLKKNLEIDLYKINKIKTEFSNNLLKFISACKIDGINIILMTQPSNYSVLQQKKSLNEKKMLELHNELNGLIIDISKKNNINFIDLNKFFHKKQKKSTYFYDQMHLNDKGNLVASDFIFKEIKKFLK